MSGFMGLYGKKRGGKRAGAGRPKKLVQPVKKAVVAIVQKQIALNSEIKEVDATGALNLYRMVFNMIPIDLLAGLAQGSSQTTSLLTSGMDQNFVGLQVKLKKLQLRISMNQDPTTTPLIAQVRFIVLWDTDPQLAYGNLYSQTGSWSTNILRTDQLMNAMQNKIGEQGKRSSRFHIIYDRTHIVGMSANRNKVLINKDIKLNTTLHYKPLAIGGPSYFNKALLLYALADIDINYTPIGVIYKAVTTFTDD